MTPPPSDYIKALYQVVNTARDERGYQAAITELQKIEGGNLFEFCVTNQNLPHESRYVRINPKALPAIVGSIYFLLRDPIYKRQHLYSWPYRYSNTRDAFRRSTTSNNRSYSSQIKRISSRRKANLKNHQR